jgi:hypothetical protein
LPQRRSSTHLLLQMHCRLRGCEPCYEGTSGRRCPPTPPLLLPLLLMLLLPHRRYRRCCCWSRHAG